MNKNPDNNGFLKNPIQYFGFGIVMGAALGLAFDNILLGIGLGILYGALTTLLRRNKE